MKKALFPSQGKGHDDDENEKENNETLSGEQQDGLIIDVDRATTVILLSPGQYNRASPIKCRLFK